MHRMFASSESRKSGSKLGGLAGVAEAIIDLNAKEANLTQLNRTYAVPANYKEALVHRQASSYGYSSRRLKGDAVVPECPCC
jgi:hypothetical protein